MVKTNSENAMQYFNKVNDPHWISIFCIDVLVQDIPIVAKRW